MGGEQQGGGPSSKRWLLSARALVGGVFAGALATLLAGVVVSLFLAFTEWEGPSHALMQAINYGSAILGGALAGRFAGRYGWIHGALVGFFYVIVLSLPAGRRGILALASSEFLWRAVGLCAAAMVGGMCGVSTSKRPG